MADAGQVLLISSGAAESREADGISCAGVLSSALNTLRSKGDSCKGAICQFFKNHKLEPMSESYILF